MGLFDALFGTQAQAPGATQQPSGLQQLFQPETAMPIAAALLGNQGNAQNFGNAFAAYGTAKAQTSAKNKTMDFFRQNSPEFAAMVDAGMPMDEAWKTYTQKKYAQKGQGIVNAGGGNLYDAQTGHVASSAQNRSWQAVAHSPVPRRPFLDLTTWAPWERLLRLEPKAFRSSAACWTRAL
jgi:hypothetical protein